MRRRPLSSPARATGWFVLGLLVVQGLWILVIPPFDGTDEMDHVYRALTLADGQVVAARRAMRPDEGRGDVVSVRRDVVAAAYPTCLTFRRYIGVHNCEPIAAQPDGQVLIGSAAAAYDPVGYLAPALASRLTRGYRTVYAMRAASAVLCTAVLAMAFWTTVRFTRTRWPTLFLLTVLTPTTLFMTTAVNPSGPHLASATLLWLSLLLLYGGEKRAPWARRTLLAAAVVSAVLLPATHSLGLGWAPAILATAVISVGLRRSARVVAEAPREHLVAAAVVAFGWLASLAWVLLAHTNDPARVPTRATGSPFPGVLYSAVVWPFQVVAAVPSRDEPAPALVYLLWALATSALVVAGLRCCGRRARLTCLLILAVSAVVPVGLTVLTYSHLGLGWQGRYGSPYLCGAALVVATALDRRRVALPVWLKPATVVLALVLGQGVAMAAVVSTKTRLPVWRDVPHLPYPSVAVLGGATVLVAWAWLRAVRELEPPTHPVGAPALVDARRVLHP